MLARLLVPLVLFVAAAGASVAQETRAPYPFDTTLSGGYGLAHREAVDPDGGYPLDVLYLTRGDSLLCELSASSRGLPFKNLGYLAADFGKTFVLAHSFGSGNPHDIAVFEKASCRELVQGTYLDIAEDGGLVLFCLPDSNGSVDSLRVFDTRTGRTSAHAIPRQADSVFASVMWHACITLERVRQKTFSVAFRLPTSMVRKVYRR